MIYAHIILAFLVMLNSCGYHLAGSVSSLPPDVKKIAIPLFTNRTLRPDIETQVTGALLNEFVKGKKVETVGEEYADAVVRGVVASFDTTPVSYVSGDVILEYRVTVRLDVSLVRKSDETVLWKDKNISYFAEYRNDPDSSVAEANRDEAVRKIASDVARQLYANMLEGF